MRFNECGVGKWFPLTPSVYNEPQMEVEMAYCTYACKEYPGMETCSGRFEAETEEELWKHIELHASVAHKENPAAWSAEDKAQLKAVIRKIKQPA